MGAQGDGSRFPTEKAPELSGAFSVGMIRLERTTPTSRTWCASQLRYIPFPEK